MKLFRFFFVLILSLAWVPSSQAVLLDKSTPILDGTDLYQLHDQIYYFPANYSPDDPTVILPLRKWDVIFTGDHINPPDSDSDLENVNNLIPGPFNHMMIYMGKDDRGLAYAIELNMSSLEQGGHLSLICLGSDFGILRHPYTSRIHNRTMMTHRWAMRLVDEAHERLLMNEQALLEQLYNDMLQQFPYQIIIEHSGNFLDRNIYLVDDGFVGGASCSDYWTTLFELYADLCIKNVRMGVQEAADYFHNDPQGRLAYVPVEVEMFPEPILVRKILDIGFRVVYDSPHIFSCDGTEEKGIVFPSLIMQSDQLEEIPQLPFPVPLYGRWAVFEKLLQVYLVAVLGPHP